MPATTSMTAWQLGLYYGYVLLTLTVCVYTARKGVLKLLPVINGGILLGAGVLHVLVSAGRPEGFNEFGILFRMASRGHGMAMLVLAAYLFTLIWWLLAVKCTFGSKKRGLSPKRM